jgi:hypothetical protein
MRLIVALLCALVVAVPARALTLYNSQDPKAVPASGKASEQLNHALSKMFEVFAAVERRSFDEAEAIKQESVKLFVDSSNLFTAVASQASKDPIVLAPRDDEDQRTMARMTQLAGTYGVKTEGLSEQQLFAQLSKILADFSNQLSKFPPSAFAKDYKDQRLASQFLASTIRLQEFGRITTAYLAIPRSR